MALSERRASRDPHLYKGNRFNRQAAKGVICLRVASASEQPDSQYPLVLSTVREVGHYSCRTMTGNCAALQVLADEPGYLQIHGSDAQKLSIQDQELVWVSSRRGKVMSRASVTDRVNAGAVYMTYQWWIGACNELTIHARGPDCKNPGV